MTPETFDKKKLQARFLEYAKVYHPDRQRGKNEAESKTFADRFKRVVHAHSILKDDKARRNWDLSHRFATGSGGHSPGRASYYTYPADRAQAWSDFRGEDGKPFFSKAQEAKFQESMRENRMFLLKCVTGVALLIAIIEFSALKSRAERQTKQIEEESHKNHALYLASLSNYNMGNSAEDRIERFLQHRERFLKRTPDRSYAGMTQNSK